MSQPTIEQLFGIGATHESAVVNLPSSIFTDAGITDFGAATPLELWAVLITTGAAWLEANTDSAVMASASTYVSAPSTRNGLDKTQFNKSIALYGAYTNPVFNPNDL